MHHETEFDCEHQGHCEEPEIGRGRSEWWGHHGYPGGGRMHHHGGGVSCGCGYPSHRGGGMRHGPGFGPGFNRRFISKGEVIAGLEEYLAQLKAEAAGVEERIAELKKEQG